MPGKELSLQSPAASRIYEVKYEAVLKYAVDFLNGENIVWNTDYPHADGMEPARALPDFDAHPISDEARRKILWDNAVKLYGQRLIS